MNDTHVCVIITPRTPILKLARYMAYSPKLRTSMIYLVHDILRTVMRLDFQMELVWKV